MNSLCKVFIAAGLVLMSFHLSLFAARVVKNNASNSIEFQDATGNPLKSLQLSARESQQGDIYINETVNGCVSDNSMFAAVLSEKKIIRPDMVESKTTFRYYNAAGNVVWEKTGVENVFPPIYSVSADGFTVAVVTATIADGDTIYSASLYNDKGDCLWTIGSYSKVREIIITKNGKYGYLKYEKPNANGGKEQKAAFFDVINKKIHIPPANTNGICRITGSGRAGVSTVVQGIYVLDDGSVEFYEENGFLKFVKPLNELTAAELANLTSAEVESIKRLVASRQIGDISRTKEIYTFQF